MHNDAVSKPEHSTSPSAELTLSDEDVLTDLRTHVGEDTYLRLIGLFLAELERSKIGMNQAIREKNTEQLHDIAHILKNSAALYGAISLAQISLTIHDASTTDWDLASIMKKQCIETLKHYSSNHPQINSTNC